MPNSKLSETSYIQSQMHFDDSMESIADSNLEDGELQKMLTSQLYVQKASGKLDAMFSSEQGDLISSSVFRNTDPPNLRGFLLEGNKDHLLNQARSELMKQEHQVGSLIAVSSSNKLMLKGWNWRTPITYILNLEDSKFDCKKNHL